MRRCAVSHSVVSILEFFRLRFVWGLAAFFVLQGSMFATSVGLSYDQQGYVQNQKIESPGYPDQGVSNLSVTSYANGFSLVGGDGSISQIASKLTPSNNNVALREFAQITQIHSGSAATANMFFGDTFSIHGPTGQTGNILINLVLDSNVSSSAGNGEARANLSLIENGTYLGVNGYSGYTLVQQSNVGPNPHQDYVLNLPVAAGAVFTLDEFLQVHADDLPSAVVNASDTGYMTIASTVPGFSFTTSSGLTYSEAPLTSQTPEPTTALLLGAGIVSLCFTGGLFKTRPRNGQREL